MAKNIEKEIAELQGAINSPATPEAQKVVMRNILAKLQSQGTGTLKKVDAPSKEALKKIIKITKPNNPKGTTPGKIITYSDGFKWEVVPNSFAKNNWDKMEIFVLSTTTEQEALVESEDDLNDTDVYAIEYKEKAKGTTKDTKKSNSLDDYNCDELIEKEKAKAKKRVENAVKKANAPKKTEATKNKERIEKVADVVETNLEKRLAKNEVSVEEIRKLIDKTENFLKKLKEALSQAR